MEQPDSCTRRIGRRRQDLQFRCLTSWKWRNRAGANIIWDSGVAMVRATLWQFTEELVLYLYCSVKPSEQVKWLRNLKGKITKRMNYFKMCMWLIPSMLLSWKTATAAGYVHLNPLMCLTGSKKARDETSTELAPKLHLIKQKGDMRSIWVGTCCFSASEHLFIKLVLLLLCQNERSPAGGLTG